MRAKRTKTSLTGHKLDFPSEFDTCATLQHTKERRQNLRATKEPVPIDWVTCLQNAATGAIYHATLQDSTTITRHTIPVSSTNRRACSPPPSTRETAPPLLEANFENVGPTEPEWAHQAARVSDDKRRPSQQRKEEDKRISHLFAARLVLQEARAWAREAGVEEHDQKAPSQPAAEGVQTSPSMR
jgi:hypothetical protein